MYARYGLMAMTHILYAQLAQSTETADKVVSLQNSGQWPNECLRMEFSKSTLLRVRAMS